MTDTAPLIAAVDALAADVGSVTLPLPLAGTEDARVTQRRLVDQLRDHLLPRLADRDAPLLVVVGGSTGAGKSTLVNSLVGEPVSRTGVLRPTTRSPVLVHHPDDGGAFAGDRVLPGLRRVGGRQVEDDGVLALVASERIGPGLAVLDAPDVDSVASANRELSRQLLAAADLWLFATTPARYADAVPWELLTTAAARGTSVAIVLGRVEDDARDAVSAHLRQMLDDGGLADAALLVVPSAGVSDEQLPADATAQVRAHLDALAGDAQARREVVDTTLRGALDSLEQRTHALADAVTAQLAAAADLDERAEAAHEHAMRTVREAVDDGRLLRGEVLTRWHEFVGAGDLLRWLESGIGRLRDRFSALWRGGRSAAAPLTDALGDGLVQVLVEAVERARQDTDRAWRAGPGAALIDAAGPRTVALTGRARGLVQRWQDEVVELVRDQAGDKRSSARIVALGLNGAAASLMVAVFASTGGLTGAEVGVAGGTSVVAQRLLEALLGDQAVRSLTTQARETLLGRTTELLEEERAVHAARLASLGLDAELPQRLVSDLAAVRAARREAGL